MPKTIIPNPTDKGTTRPLLKLLLKKGDCFKPMILPKFDYEIRLPDYVFSKDPITLFTLYYTTEIID
jgi:hypothetical protein